MHRCMEFNSESIVWQGCGKTLEEVQVSLEEEMQHLGIERFRKSVEKSKSTNQESVSLHGILLMKKSVDGLSKAIRSFIEEANTGQGGRKHTAAPLISLCDTEVVAYLTLRMVMDSISNRQKLTKTAFNVGQAIEDHIKLSIWKDADGVLFEELKKKLQRRSSSRHFRRYGLIRNLRNRIEVEESEAWTKQEKILVGVKLVELLAVSTSIIEIRTVSHGQRNRTIYIYPTEEAINWIEKVNREGELLNPYLMPMVIPPDDWTNPRNGGYKTYRLNLVKTHNKRLMDELEHKDLGIEYDVINALQKTAWKVNKPVLDVMLQAWEMGGLWEGIPHRDPLEIPPSPMPPELKKQDMTKEEWQTFVDWKKDATLIYDENARRRSKVIAFLRTMGLAKKFCEIPKFYFVYQNDFRGRKYTVSSFLSPQGTEYSKALLTFAEGLPIETDEQSDWLAIHGANCFGVDKVTYDDRISWVDENFDHIKRSAEDPMGHRFWQDADDPWMFLAFCFEWNEFMKHGFGYVSSLPVSLDGSNNGLQHFSAMLRDPVGAKATNLSCEEKPQDIYQEVADVALEYVQESDELMAKQWLESGLIDRKLCKRPVMVVPYGGGQYSCKRYIEERMREAFMDGVPNPWKGMDLYIPAQWMSKHVWRAIGKVVVSAREAMDWIREVVGLVAKEGYPMIWTTPSGFIVYQQYPFLKSRRITTHIDGNLIKPAYNEEDYSRVDMRRSKNGSSPNLVHSLDAAALSKTIHKCIRLHIKDYCMVHDSYGTQAHNVPKLAKALREEFVDMYVQHDVLEEFKRSAEEVVGEIPDPPAQSTFDIRNVLKSEYFFS